MGMAAFILFYFTFFLSDYIESIKVANNNLTFSLSSVLSEQRGEMFPHIQALVLTIDGLSVPFFTS